MALTPGTKLARYEIRSQLGAGGMGEVYRARDTKIGRDVAVKVLPSAFSADPDRLQRFQQESHSARRYGSGRDNGNGRLYVAGAVERTGCPDGKLAIWTRRLDSLNAELLRN